MNELHRVKERKQGVAPESRFVRQEGSLAVFELFFNFWQDFYVWHAVPTKKLVPVVLGATSLTLKNLD